MRQPQRGAEGLRITGAVAGGSLRRAELEQQLTALAPLGGKVALVDLQRQAQQAHRLVVRGELGGAARRAHGAVKRAHGIALWQRMRMVESQLHQAGIDTVGAALLKLPGDRAVPAQALPGRQFFIQHVAHQRVAELAATRRPRFDHMLRQCFVDRRQRDASTPQRHQQIDVENAADASCRRKHAAARRRQTVQPLADQLAYARRDVQLQRVEALLMPWRCSVIVAQKAQHLDDEQRVAFGALPDRRNPCRRQARAAARGDQPFGLRMIEALQVHAREARCAQQLGQRLAQGMLARQFGVAVGPQHHDALPRQLRREEAQQSQRAGIGPVQILENQQQGLQLGQTSPQVRHRHEQPEPRLIAVERGQRRQARTEVARQARDDFDRRRRVATEQRAEIVRLERVQPGFERPRPRQEGRCTRFLQAAAPQRAHAAPFGQRGGFLGESRLADARFAGQHQPRPLAGERLLNRRLDPCELRLAPDQPIVRCRRRRCHPFHGPIVGKKWTIQCTGKLSVAAYAAWMRACAATRAARYWLKTPPPRPQKTVLVNSQTVFVRATKGSPLLPGLIAGRTRHPNFTNLFLT